jgi:predicted DNA-binding transcriptional regulator AlpA
MHEIKEMWRLARVIDTLGIKKSTVWQRGKDGYLPRPVRISVRAVAWPSDEICKIVDAQIAGCSGNALVAFVSELVAARPKWP